MGLVVCLKQTEKNKIIKKQTSFALKSLNILILS